MRYEALIESLVIVQDQTCHLVRDDTVKLTNHSSGAVLEEQGEEGKEIDQQVIRVFVIGGPVVIERQAFSHQVIRGHLLVIADHVIIGHKIV